MLEKGKIQYKFILMCECELEYYMLVSSKGCIMCWRHAGLVAYILCETSNGRVDKRLDFSMAD